MAMRRIIALLSVFILLGGFISPVTAKEVNLSLGEAKVQTMTVRNPLIIDDVIEIDFLLDENMRNKINYWMEGYSRDKRDFEIGAQSNKTIHLIIEGAMCNQDTCNGPLTVKASSKTSKLSSRKSFNVNLTAGTEEDPVGSAPGMNFYGIIALAIAGGIIFAFGNKGEEN